MGSTLGSSATVELAGKIMVIFIIVILLITIFVMFLHLYAKWHWWQIEVPEAHRRQQQRRRRRLVFVPADEEEEEVSIRGRGLHPAVLKSLPIISFSHGDEECVCGVCLCEVVEGEKARVLPKCNHAFHLDCIDMWFRSHATCPLCRQNPAPVLEVEMMIMISTTTTHDQTSFTSSSMEKQQEDHQNLTNAFSTGASSSSSSSLSTDERALVIDIPCLSPSPSLCSLSAGPG